MLWKELDKGRVHIVPEVALIGASDRRPFRAQLSRQPCYTSYPGNTPPPTQHCLGLAPSSQPSEYHISKYKIFIFLCQHKCLDKTMILFILFKASKILVGA